MSHIRTEDVLVDVVADTIFENPERQQTLRRDLRHFLAQQERGVTASSVLHELRKGASRDTHRGRLFITFFDCFPVSMTASEILDRWEIV